MRRKDLFTQTAFLKCKSVEGSILDASLRMSYAVQEDLSLFANARFFGGTSNGTSKAGGETWTESEQKYTKNNIASLTFSAGLTYQL